MAPGAGKQFDVARLKADLAAAGVELLSAHLRRRSCSSPIFSAGHCCFRGAAFPAASDRFRRGSLPLLLPNRGSHQQPTRHEPVRRSSRHRALILSNCQLNGNAREPAYFSTRINSPVEALTATVSLAPSRLEP